MIPRYSSSTHCDICRREEPTRLFDGMHLCDHCRMRYAYENNKCANCGYEHPVGL